jgi:hypothetical protein
MHPYILDITLLKKIMHPTCYRYNMWGAYSLNKVIYITLGKPDGLNIMLSKQKGICNFRLRPSVEENLQMCARQVVLSHISRYFEKCFRKLQIPFCLLNIMLRPSGLPSVIYITLFKEYAPHILYL